MRPAALEGNLVDVMLRDKVLICRQCGNQFVYTIGQQRMALEELGHVNEPSHCPLCEVKRVHGVRVHAPTPLQNGYHEGDDFVAPSSMPSWGDADDHSGADNQPAHSPNRPVDYRSGEEHPLYGHGGRSQYGMVKWFNDRKGFGFVTLDSGVDLFVHYSGIVGDGYRTLKQGQRVTLVLEDTAKGPQASQVAVLPGVESSEQPHPPAEESTPDLPY